MSVLRKVYLLLLLVGTALLSLEIYEREGERREMKTDLIELSRVKYGLFNIDEWKAIASGVISKKIEEFELNDENREMMREKISTLLRELIGTEEDRFFKDNEGSLGGWFRKSVASITGLFGHLRGNVPEITEKVLDFLDDPENRENLRKFIIEQLEAYTDKTFSEVDYSIHDAILLKYGAGDRASCQQMLSTRLAERKDAQWPLNLALFGLIGLAAAYLFLASEIRRQEFFMLTCMAICLLVLGLSLPMIDIDARISSMRFRLLGEQVSFVDQVLYYKSKSILEVVWLMLSQQKIDLMLVGLLVLSFSVLFPVSKLLASLAYLYFPGIRNKKSIKFMVYRTGKWSMADVMVIAIFMSYIGFTGIITEQLKQLGEITTSLEVLTTNNSSLQTGFFVFTTFAVLSLLIAHKMQYHWQKETSAS